jgi:hypothetical protein
VKLKKQILALKENTVCQLVLHANPGDPQRFEYAQASRELVWLHYYLSKALVEEISTDEGYVVEAFRENILEPYRTKLIEQQTSGLGNEGLD